MKNEAKMPVALISALTSERTELLVPWWTKELAEPSEGWTREDQVDTIAVLAARIIEQKLKIREYENKLVSTFRVIERLNETMGNLNRDLSRLSTFAKADRGTDLSEDDDG